MYAGVNQCYNYIEKKPGNRVIVIVTDGDDNGTPSASSLIASKASSGVAIVSVGLGSSVDEDYLKSISDIYYPVEEIDVNKVASLLSKGICEAPDVTEKPKPTKTPKSSKPPMPTKIPPSSSSCVSAFQMCDFKFQNANSVPTFAVTGKPDRVFTSKIVSKMLPRIGLVNMNDITPEFIEADGTVIPITAVGNPPLAPTHFKPFPFYTSGASGLGHQSFTGDQLQQVKGRCVRVYFSSYQTLADAPSRNVADNVEVSKSDNKCVVFRTA